MEFGVCFATSTDGKKFPTDGFSQLAAVCIHRSVFNSDDSEGTPRQTLNERRAPTFPTLLDSGATVRIGIQKFIHTAVGRNSRGKWVSDSRGIRINDRKSWREIAERVSDGCIGSASQAKGMPECLGSSRNTRDLSAPQQVPDQYQEPSGPEDRSASSVDTSEDELRLAPHGDLAIDVAEGFSDAHSNRT